MFNKIAFRYDFLNRFLSAGIDRKWRKKAIRELFEFKTKTILDVATGTADMPIMMIRQLSPEKVNGIDISEAMLELGKTKNIQNSDLEKSIRLQTEMRKNLFSECFICCGNCGISVFVIFKIWKRDLSEMFRVLRPGGKLVILEFSKPTKGYFLPFYKIYLRCSRAPHRKNGFRQSGCISIPE